MLSHCISPLVLSAHTKILTNIYLKALWSNYATKLLTANNVKCCSICSKLTETTQLFISSLLQTCPIVFTPHPDRISFHLLKHDILLFISIIPAKKVISLITAYLFYYNFVLFFFSALLLLSFSRSVLLLQVGISLCRASSRFSLVTL